ncbi:hypothetical protein [Apilactobacillus kunkeei]|uniref:hypothetical protein n=1 Tax=Apilactobacillus kunkeei TaxID=148814 RepID=UPI0006B23D1F|nr:hypothetical protein [Apilactobacillus kunkeei]
MWNTIAILLFIFAIYEVVKSIKDRGVVRDILNNYDNVVKVRAMIEEHNDDSEIVNAIKDEFNVRFYPAARIFMSVKKMK